MEQNKLIWVLGIVVVLLIFTQGMFLQKVYQLFVALPNEPTTTITVPTSVESGNQFNIDFVVTNAPAKWGSILVLNYAGGCKFSEGATQFKGVMLSSEGPKKIIAAMAPTSGTCTLSGYYAYDINGVTHQFSYTTNVCTRKTNADTNCDNSVSDSEILSYISKWLKNEISDTEILSGISGWVSS